MGVNTSPKAGFGKNPVFDTTYVQYYDPRPMSGALPAEIDPFELAADGAVLEGAVSQADFDRLIPDPVARKEPVQFRLEFEPADRGAVLMRGRIETVVPLLCQRCMNTLLMPLTVKPAVLFARPRQAAGMTASEVEVIVVEERIPLRPLLEDELLLGLPMIPMHDQAECPATEYIKGTAREEGEERQQPFAGLKALLDSKRQD